MIDKVKALEELLSPSAEAEGMEIVEVQYLKENGDWTMRVFIDKESGIQISDCEKMSYIFGEILDGSDILKDSYVLEISSPGINRALKKEKDFIRFIGEKVRMQTFNPVNNQRNFLGILTGFKNGMVKIDDVTKGEVEVEFSDIKKANLEADI
jgi:Uncharacterized protein conserved in bacteria